MKFLTNQYFRSHSNPPRGRGSWAFCPDEFARRGDYLDHTKFSPGGMLLSEAKAWAKKQQWPEGCEYLEIMP